MNTRTMIVFVAVFLVVYIAISWFDSGSINWGGAIGGAFGAALALAVIWYLRSRSSESSN